MEEAVLGTVFNFGPLQFKKEVEKLKLDHRRAVTMGRNLAYIPKPQSVTAASCYVAWHYQEELGPIAFVPSLSLAIRSPPSLLFNKLYQFSSLCLSCRACYVALGCSESENLFK